MPARRDSFSRVSKLSCESCGANLEPSHLACPFCKAPTPYAREQHAQEEHARQQQNVAEAVAKQRYDAASRANAQTELDRLARQSVVWSGVGVLFCCFPIPALVALVLVYRARALAREQGFVFPAQATIGLVLSVMTLLSTVGFYVFSALSPTPPRYVTPTTPALSAIPTAPRPAPTHVAPHHAPSAPPSIAPVPTAPKPH